MSDVGANIFAEWGVVPEYVVQLSFFSLWQAHFVRGVECNGTRFRRMLFHMKGPLGQWMFFVEVARWLFSW